MPANLDLYRSVSSVQAVKAAGTLSDIFMYVPHHLCEFDITGT